MIRAVGLLSGGLDSTLAAKMLIDQGIEVFAVNFTSPFCTCTPKSAGCSAVATAIQQLGNIPLKKIGMGQNYIDMIRSPKYGYGRGMNPCIDCRILKLKLAADYMREIGAQFLFTGEVLGQRPMSQHRKALDIIDMETGMGDLILRPLSAQALEPTLPERSGWVNREQLLALVGRSRKPQIALAHDKGILDYPCSAGGCLLTDENFAQKIRDYFAHVKAPNIADMSLMRIGRHAYTESHDWIIVGRNEQEGERLEKMSRADAIQLLPTNFSAPVVMVIGSDRKAALDKMLEYTNRDIPDDAVLLIRQNGESQEVGKQQWNMWVSSCI
jgi:tRNA-specific 2-thiouridylase